VDIAISATEAITEIKQVEASSMSAWRTNGDLLVGELLACNSRLAIAVASAADEPELRWHFANASPSDFLQKAYIKEQLPTLASRDYST
jgi:hypothetical protein